MEIHVLKKTLTENIDCDQTLHNMEDVEFVTNVDYREINTITGFKIMTHVYYKERLGARLEADWMEVDIVGGWSTYR